MKTEAQSRGAGDRREARSNDMIGELQERQWYAWMDDLEASWTALIARTQAEYIDARKRRNHHRACRPDSVAL